MVDHVVRFSPRNSAASDWPLDRMIVRGGDLFAELAPPDVAQTVRGIHQNPDPLARALDQHEESLLHWGTLSAVAPPAVEFVSYLAICWAQIEASKDDIIDDHESRAGGRFEPCAFGLALLLGLAHLGWNKALAIVDESDERKRSEQGADLDWWITRVRDEREWWSPT